MHNRINNIQILRGFAAVLVLYFHSNFIGFGKYPTGGFGVDIFFVISGYIMAMICEVSPSKFFLRRVIRIVPPYWAFTLLVFGIAAARPQLVGATNTSVVDLVMSLFFIPFRKGSNLIQPTLVVGWTLNYEMYFYSAIALALLVSKKWAPVLASAAVVVVFGTLRLFAAKTTAGQFYGADISLEFVLGVGTYYVATRTKLETLTQAKGPLVCLAIGALGYLLWFDAYRPPAMQGTPHVLLFGIASALLMVSVASLSRVGLDLENRPLILLGDASYVLYLSHAFVFLAITRVLAPKWHWLSEGSFPMMAVGIVASVAFAVLLHRYGERPALAFFNRHLLKRGGRAPAPLAPPTEYQAPPEPADERTR
jgi:peptidoglycan/LPS O-acetylase OafA/YrhL